MDLHEEVEFEAGVIGDQDGGGEGAAGDEEDEGDGDVGYQGFFEGLVGEGDLDLRGDEDQGRKREEEPLVDCEGAEVGEDAL